MSRNDIQKCNSEGTSPIFNYRDRMIFAKKELVPEMLIYTQQYTNYKVVNDDTLTYVYLDVSGSVSDELGKYVSLLIEPYSRKKCRVFSFSEVVNEVTYAQLKSGKFISSYGTNVNCIFDHFFSLPINKRPKKILIMTDGYTGIVNSKHFLNIKNENIEVYCALICKDSSEYYLKEICREIKSF